MEREEGAATKGETREMSFFRGKGSAQSNDSNAQVKVLIALQKRGLNILLSTNYGLAFDLEEDGVEGMRPDFYWMEPYRYVADLDGEVHLRSHVEKRDTLIDLACWRRNIAVDRFPYRSPLTNKRCAEIVGKIGEFLRILGYIPFRG